MTESDLNPLCVAELLRAADEAFSLLLRLREREKVANAPEIARIGMALQAFGTYPREREALAKHLSDSASGND